METLLLFVPLLFVVAIFWCAPWSIAGAYVARAKHRSTAEGITFAILLGPLGLIVVACLPTGSAVSGPDPEDPDGRAPRAGRGAAEPGPCPCPRRRAGRPVRRRAAARSDHAAADPPCAGPDDGPGGIDHDAGPGEGRGRQRGHRAGVGPRAAAEAERRWVMLDELTRRIGNIEEKCESLERGNRCWRATAVLSTGILAVIAFCGSGKPGPTKIVEAEVFRLLDSSSRVRAQLAIRPRGGVELVFQDEKGQARLSMGAKEDGSPVIYFFDPGEKARMELAVDAAGEVRQSMYNKAGAYSLGTRVFADDSVSTIIYGADKNPRFGFEVSPDGTSSLSLQHKDQNRRILLQVDSAGISSQRFTDKNGKDRIIASVQQDGSVNQSVHASKGKGAVSISILDDDTVTQTLHNSTGSSQFFFMAMKDGQLASGYLEKDVLTKTYISKEFLQGHKGGDR